MQMRCAVERTEGVCALALNRHMNRVKTRSQGIPPVRADHSSRRDNLLLAAMPAAERRTLVAVCEPVELIFGSVLCKQGARIRHVYFPTGGFISLLSQLDTRPGLEVGLVGAEGAVGTSLVLGVSIAPLTAVVQGAGSALRIKATQLTAELDRSPALKAAMSRYLYVLVTQLAAMASCTRFHVVEARLARWLMMTRDRAGSDEFYLTQEFMAYMLGVRRVGVSSSARVLGARKLIRYSRGSINILDVPGLEGAACSCYATAKDVYTRFMRPT